MKIKIDRDILLHGLEVCGQVVLKQSSLKSLECYYLCAGTTLRMGATDLSTSIICCLDCNVMKAGELVVPKQLHALVKNFAKGMVTLQYNKKKLIVSSGKSKYRLEVIGPCDFPSLPQRSIKDFDFSGEELHRMLRMIKHSMCDNEVQWHLCCAYIEISSSHVKLTTTDGHRLSHIAAECSTLPDDINKSGSVRRVAIQALDKSLNNALDVCIGMTGEEFHVTQHIMVNNVVVGEMFLVSKIMETKFPDYNKALPKNNDIIINIDRKEFLTILKRGKVVAKGVANNTVNTVKLHCIDSVLNVSVDNQSVGRFSEAVDIETSVKDFRVGFSVEYLIDVLNALEDKKVVFEFGGAVDGVLIKDETKSFIGCVMPRNL